jgi:methyl-accepting chemotaxis protein
MTERQSRRRWFAVVSLFVVVGIAALVIADRRLSEGQVSEASDDLLLLMTLRKGALESYFDTVRAELTFWSMSEPLQQHMDRLATAWNAIPGEPIESLQAGYIEANPFPPDQRSRLDAVEDGSLYAEAHRAIHPLAKEFVSERGYYDFFLIDPSGSVVYSVEKESDFAQNLRSSELRDSGLARVYRRALDSASERRVVFSDFARYGPSQGAPALFGAVPIHASDGSLLGVLAMQVPSERIHDIMQFTAGMGRTGETYLVGSDYLMRSDSRFSDVPTTLETRVESATVERALESQTGVDFTDDYRGVPVLSAYGTFVLDEFSWAVMAEIDREEIFEAISELRLSVPLLGLALYGLAMISLWAFGSESWGVGEIDGIETGDFPAP